MGLLDSLQCLESRHMRALCSFGDHGTGKRHKGQTRQVEDATMGQVTEGGKGNYEGSRAYQEPERERSEHRFKVDNGITYLASEGK